MSNLWENDEVIQRFREYLKIPSVHPDVDYSDCITFLKRQAAELGLPATVHELVLSKPVLVMTWTGTSPQLPSILLNSHMDVVPVYEDQWSHPPFAAHIEDGWIYARGTQDMKGVGMAHLEAVRSLKNAGVRLKRTVHISFVPDEEIGSLDGMRKFSESEEFENLNIGFELDESVVHEKPNQFHAFHGEKTTRLKCGACDADKCAFSFVLGVPVNLCSKGCGTRASRTVLALKMETLVFFQHKQEIKITCDGTPGHGSLMASGTAGEKFHVIVDKFMTFRAQELKKLQSGALLGDVFSINLTQVEGGVLVNVVPASLSVSFDIRIPPDVDHDEFERTIESWCQEAGEGVNFEYVVKNPEIKSTKIDGCLPFWDVLEQTVENLGMKVTSVICPGATDARFVRRQGVPAINFTPFDNSPTLLHAHDERLHIDTYKKGIKVMEAVVKAVANV